MARPPKVGLDYFPLDVDIDQDDKVFRLVGEIGEVGFGRFVRLLAEIYRCGYVKRWGDREALLFAGKKGLSLPDVTRLVDACLRAGLLDERLFRERQMLTSAGIQRRYFEAVCKRRVVTVDSSLLLISLEELPSDVRNRVMDNDSQTITPVVSPQTPVCASQTPVNSDSGTQSKAKQSKAEGTEPPVCVPQTQNPPDHFAWVTSWYREYTSKTLRLVEPDTDIMAEAAKIWPRFPAQALLASIKPYFEREWWFTRSKGGSRREWSFRNYLSHLEEIIAAGSPGGNGPAKSASTERTCERGHTYVGNFCAECAKQDRATPEEWGDLKAHLPAPPPPEEPDPFDDREADHDTSG